MSSVGIHPPKTPVTKGSNGIAKATLPNVCKMPGPPAPFIPSPLPNIAKSGSSPKDYSTSVKIEGNTVAIRGAMFESMGDMASKGTGGGLISANTHGPAKFITPGSLTVKIEGKSVHLLGEPMLNNCGPSGSPPNTGATMMGVKQAKRDGDADLVIMGPDCAKAKKEKKWDDCQCAQVCEMVKAYNNSQTEKKKITPSPSRDKPTSKNRRAYVQSLDDFGDTFASVVEAAKKTPEGVNSQSVKDMFYSPPPPNADCQHKKWVDAGAPMPPPRSGASAISPDHMHPVSLNGPMTVDNMKWADADVNTKVGGGVKGKKYKPPPEKVRAHPNCNCP